MTLRKSVLLYLSLFLFLKNQNLQLILIFFIKPLTFFVYVCYTVLCIIICKYMRWRFWQY